MHLHGAHLHAARERLVAVLQCGTAACTKGEAIGAAWVQGAVRKEQHVVCTQGGPNKPPKHRSTSCTTKGAAPLPHAFPSGHAPPHH